MKDLMKDNNEVVGKKLKIFYIVIIAICVIAIISAIIIQVQKNNEEKNVNNLPVIDEENLGGYQEEFDSIFENKVNYLENNSYRIEKIQQDEDLIYSGYQIQEKRLNTYELDVDIPYININNSVVEEFNKQIVEVFENKAKSVLNSTSGDVVYTVKYCAYVSNNILSLVIRSTLKEGMNPQRDIVQTYNYDLTNQREYTVDEILEAKGITKREANQKIQEEIQRVQKNVEELQKLGYNIYSRDPQDDMYSINNVTEYFLGKDNAFYIIYAYGNQNLTDEMDIVVM